MVQPQDLEARLLENEFQAPPPPFRRLRAIARAGAPAGATVQLTADRISPEAQAWRVRVAGGLQRARAAAAALWRRLSRALGGAARRAGRPAREPGPHEDRWVAALEAEAAREAERPEADTPGG